MDNVLEKEFDNFMKYFASLGEQIIVKDLNDLGVTFEKNNELEVNREEY